MCERNKKCHRRRQPCILDEGDMHLSRDCIADASSVDDERSRLRTGSIGLETRAKAQHFLKFRVLLDTGG